MIDEPKFSKGNAGFAKALNSVVAFAKRNGVNPRGLPGWNQTADGWKPPTIPPSVLEGIDPWDIVSVPTDPEEDEGDPEFTLFRPIVRADRSDLENTISVVIEGGHFLPEADSWLIAEINEIPIGTVTIKLITDAALSALDGYPSCYEFGSGPGFAFEQARIPLWRFYDTDTEDYEGGRVQILKTDEETIYGEKLVASSPLQVVYVLAEVPDEAVVRAVPDLL
jgi:hypothetical protein